MKKNPEEIPQACFDYSKTNVIERLSEVQKEFRKEDGGKSVKQLIGKSPMGFALLIISVLDCKFTSINKKSFIALDTILKYLESIDDIIKLKSDESRLEYYMGLDLSNKILLESIYERLIFEFGKEGGLKETVKRFFESIHKKARELKK